MRKMYAKGLTCVWSKFYIMFIPSVLQVGEVAGGVELDCAVDMISIEEDPGKSYAGGENSADSGMGLSSTSTGNTTSAETCHRWYPASGDTDAIENHRSGRTHWTNSRGTSGGCTVAPKATSSDKEIRHSLLNTVPSNASSNLYHNTVPTDISTALVWTFLLDTKL